VKNPDLTIEQYLKETIAKIGENIVIRRFVRYELGEGIEKRSEDFAAEVAKVAKG
jgi:elongation factor Ts